MEQLADMLTNGAFTTIQRKSLMRLFVSNALARFRPPAALSATSKVALGEKIWKIFFPEVSHAGGHPAHRARDGDPQNTLGEKSPEKKGNQSPIENGQYMVTTPRLDEPSDTVAPCGVFTN